MPLNLSNYKFNSIIQISLFIKPFLQVVLAQEEDVNNYFDKVSRINNKTYRTYRHMYFTSVCGVPNY